MPPFYNVYWLDEDGNTLDIYILESYGPTRARTSVTNRMRQSQHKLPQGCMGFRVKESAFVDNLDPHQSLRMRMEIYAETLKESGEGDFQAKIDKYNLENP